MRKLLAFLIMLLSLSLLPLASCGPAQVPTEVAVVPTGAPVPAATTRLGVTVTVVLPATVAAIATDSASAEPTAVNTPERRPPPACTPKRRW